MNERVLEIVVYIVDKMSSSADENVISEIEGLSENLLKQGYTSKEIDSAFDWLTQNLSLLGDENSIDLNHLLTQLTDVDNSTPQSNLKPISTNSVIPLKELDVIGEDELEQILEQSSRLGKNGVTISEIKAKVANLILNPDDASKGSFFVFNQSYYGH